jgi:hypothetical protein
MKKAMFLVGLCLVLAPSRSIAWNQSEIHWLTISTEHFRIQYHKGLEHCATEAAAIAESMYGPITGLYRYKPDGPVYLNISDVEDESNGATYYYLNRIDFSAEPYDFWFRGSTSWLSDVIAHEFTHMVSIQSTFKYPRWIPSLYLQALNFEKEKRPDVIYGYPNLQVSVPVPGELIPNWFAEGMAQYQSAGTRHDIWDSHRDMMLRTAFLNDKLLTLDEMGVFGKTSRGSEMVYNQGFSLVRFIAKRFGEDKVRELASAFGAIRTVGFGGPCKRVLGMSGEDLYRAWKEDLAAQYRPVAATVRTREIDGERIAGDGFMNLFPAFARDAGDFYYVSNRGRDYVDLDIVRNTADGEIKRVVSGVSSRFSVAPDGTRICFSRKIRSNDRGYLRNDLYIYSVDSKKEKRLTRGLRVTNPVWSPDGARIACVVAAEGRQRVALVESGTGKHTFLTPAVRAQDREYMGLSWGAGGLLATRFEGSSRDIVLIDPGTGAEEPIVATNADERDPCWSADGAGFFYASDRTGIFNIYYHEMGGGADFMVTNCIGGAFSPAAGGERILFAGYGAEGFDIRALDDWRAGSVSVDEGLDDRQLIDERLAIAMARNGGSAEARGKGFGIEYTKLFLYPRLLVFQGKPRVGLFLDSGDYLGRQNVFAGGAIGANGEFDLNLAVETRQFKPTLGFEVYRSRTRYEYQSRLEDGSNFEFRVRYDLWDAFFTCAMELRPTTRYSRQEAMLQYNHGEYGVNVELWELLKQKEFRGEGGWNYYRANELSLLLHYRSVRDEIDADINPRGGRSVDIEITKAFDKLHSGDFSFAFSPKYDRDEFGRYQVVYEEYVPLPLWRHSLALEGKAAAIDKSSINDFFYFYLGGRDGLRGYSYYSMGGTRMAFGRLTYRFPVVRNVNRQVLWLYLGSLYAGAFAEAGKAWTGNTVDLNGNKKDVGFDLRLKGFTFSSYPIAASFEAAYGLNDVVYRDPFNTFATFYEGKEWKYYGSILFSF